MVKSILKQFDSPNRKVENGLEVALDALEHELEDDDGDSLEGDCEDVGDDKNLLDGQSGMTDEEIKLLEETVKPVCIVLIKVCL